MPRICLTAHNMNSDCIFDRDDSYVVLYDFKAHNHKMYIFVVH